MKVKNINGTSGMTCNCDSWLDHWKKYSGQSFAGYCSALGCSEKSEIVGAHVQKDLIFDSSWHVVPLCKTHNGKTGESLNIEAHVGLASANTSLTCRRKRFPRYS